MLRKNYSIEVSESPGNGWQSEQIYSSAGEYYDNLLIDINNAVSSIEIAVYIFAIDNIGQRFIDALISAAQRGVSVRLLIDGIGSADDGDIIAKQLFAAGAVVHIYHPLPWYWSSYRWSLKPGGFIEKLYYFIASLNRRDHRKFFIIDQSIAWCGSFNICCDHLNDDDPWRDYGARLTGGAVKNLLENFNSVWFRREQKVTSRLLRFFRSNTSRRLRRIRNRLLVESIRTAKQRVWICSAYFSPSRAVIRAIKIARQRGVDVRLIVAGRSDVTFFPLLSATYYADLLKLGVSIYCYQAGILHAKAMLVDRQCVIGSTNLNHRSFYHDLELDVVLSAQASTARIESLFEQDTENSRKLTLESVSQWSRRLLFGWMLRIIRYWM